MTRLYLLDANVLITAKNQYYEFGRVNQYWEWLAFQAEEGNAKLPVEIYEEVAIGKDDDALTRWVKANKGALILEEDVDVGLVQSVIRDGYAADLTDIELEAIGRDPFLIAYALADIKNRIIVTTEVRSNRQRQNRTIPSVCDQFAILSCDQWQLSRDLDFRTDWKRP